MVFGPMWQLACMVLYVDLKPFGSADLSVVLHLPACSDVLHVDAGGLGASGFKFLNSGPTATLGI